MHGNSFENGCSNWFNWRFYDARWHGYLVGGGDLINHTAGRGDCETVEAMTDSIQVWQRGCRSTFRDGPASNKVDK